MSLNHDAKPSHPTFLVHSNDPNVSQHIDSLLKTNFSASKIVLAHEFKSSFNLLIEYRPNIFIIDIDQGNAGAQIIVLMNSLEVDTRVVVIAGNDPVTIDLCLAMGVKGYIIKPIDASIFMKTINDMITK